ncbi:MAG: UDP-2,4-diacetamido-2,4,6-trideoxy-beta-L-altropyranose hydrolase [Lachnospiraceae bacterium]|nr:UDP-2,4-diacetamido-2,4,6-trideoxy-beta-L-altropyranose hydrolase [Lachnospiraceae bacterium]
MILFRADGNKILGTGHIMRCLSIAEAIKKRGEECIFVCADSNMKEVITSRGFGCKVLETDFTKLDEEINLFTQADFFKKAKGIVFDSYYVTEKYLKTITALKKTVYIDDYFTKMPLTAVVNYSIYADVQAYRNVYGEIMPRLFLGTSYAPLRSEFSTPDCIKIRDKISDVLILTGGADPFHIAKSFAEKLIEKKESGLKYHFVVGAMSMDYEAMKSYEKECDYIIIHYNQKDMKTLMMSCDMAVSAAGSTQYELCSCGIPTINYTFADNQKAGATAFFEKGIMETLGDVSECKDFSEKIYSAIKKLADNPEKRRQMASEAKKVVDGRGADRLAEELEKLFL